MTDRKLPVKPVVTTTAPTSIMAYTAMSSAREKVHARPNILSKGRATAVSKKRKRTAIRGDGIAGDLRALDDEDAPRA